MNRKEIGNAGEEVAAAYLMRSGCKILEKNYRLRGGEIDLIAEEGEVLLFVEVKTRRTLAFGRPAEAVDYRKQQKIIPIAQYFLRQRQMEDRLCRFDVIEIMMQGKETKINWIQNAFET